MGRSKITPKAKEPIRLRMKDLSNGSKSLYLDIYRDGKRSYEYLKMYIIPEKDKIFFMLGMSDTWDFCPCEKCSKAVEKYTQTPPKGEFVLVLAGAPAAEKVSATAEDAPTLLFSFILALPCYMLLR